MHHCFVQPDQIGADQVVITGEDARHISRVLRMTAGDELWVRTGSDDRHIRCRIVSAGEDEVLADIEWTEHAQAELPCEIVLLQSLPKGDKMEWIIQKAVELGASRIVPMVSARSIVRLEGSRAERKVQRWNAISESAANQSHRDKIPQVTAICSYEEALRQAAACTHVLIPYERAEGMEETRRILQSIRPGESVSVMIGPEGGFEAAEVEAAIAAGAAPISLGHRILRTETAGMTLLAALMLQLDS